MATVVRIRESACSGDCHKCSGCGAAQQTIQLKAVNALGAKAGELVVISTKTTPVLIGAAVLYLLPLVMFFAGFFLGESLWQRGAVTGGVAFMLSVGLVIFYDRFVARKHEPIYTITRYADNETAARTKGDNELD